jgi:ribosome-associated heat shock protein Hsp15
MTETRQRLDKWLWFARFYKTRSLAQQKCAGGLVKLNGQSPGKTHAMVHVGDELLLMQGETQRHVRVLAMAIRRGSAPEAQALYEDVAAPVRMNAKAYVARRAKGDGRPTKKDRRELNKLKGDFIP